jgi:SLT domain-containing protein
MLGFKAGATVSVEETVEAFDRVFGGDGKFAGATDELAKTFEGTLSMIGDKVFNFKRVLLEAGFFPELKKQFGDLNKFMEENQVVLDNFATQIGEGLAVAVVQLGKGLKFVKEHNDDFILGMKIIISLKIASVFMGIAKGVLNVAKATMALAAGTSALKKGFLGIVGLFATGGIGYLVFKQIDKLFDNFLDQINEAGSGKGFDSLGKQLASMGLIAKEANFNIQNIIDSLKKEQKAIEKQKQVYYEFYLGKRRLANILAKEEQENLDRSIIAHKQYGQTRLLGIELDFQKERELQKNNFHKMLDEAHLNDLKKAQLRKQANVQLVDDARGTLQALSGINKTAFEAYKAFQIAETTINAIKTASTVYAKYATLFPLNIAIAAGALAKGMAMVAMIQSQSYSGREHGGAVTKGKPYMVGEAGREMFVPNQSGNIVPNDELGRAVNVNFNINTVDARGFNELLTNSRATIVGMINSAVNETGRQAII